MKSGPVDTESFLRRNLERKLLPVSIHGAPFSGAENQSSRHAFGIFGCPLRSIAAYTLGIADLDGRCPFGRKIMKS
jgi:hypothetical protein